MDGTNGGNGVNSDGNLTFGITKDIEISWIISRTREDGWGQFLNIADDIYQIEF